MDMSLRDHLIVVDRVSTQMPTIKNKRKELKKIMQELNLQLLSNTVDLTLAKKYSKFITKEVSKPKPKKLRPAVKRIVIVDYKRFDAFLSELHATPDVLLRLKTLIAVCLTGGLRISEALTLRRCDFDMETRHFTTKVLKKDRTTRRECKLMVTAHTILQEYLAKYPKKGFENIFDFTRQSAYNWVTELLGEKACCHMFRHSYFSYLLHEKHLGTEAVASHMKVELHAVKFYNHVNAAQTLDEVIA